MTTKMAPAKVLDAQADLLRRFETDDFKIYTSLFMLMTVMDNGRGPHQSKDEQMKRSVESMLDINLAVRNAEAYHVSAEMTQVIRYAAERLDDTDVWNSALAPSMNGIVRFDGGLQVIAGEDETWVDWIIWHCDASGTRYLLIMDAVDRPGAGAALAHASGYSQKVFGRWRWAQYVGRRNGEQIGPTTAPEWVSAVDADEPEERLTTNAGRLLHAFWLMIDQKITMISSQRPHSSARPVLKKARMPKDPKVTVVELRRHRYTGTGERPDAVAVEWSHRWLVRGFWRWQAHGEGWKERKRIYVSDYVKGPEDKPLVVKNQVFDLRR